ncbi:uncharacterized protein [Eurosta solidaginis]|uniref:uncharacterized protein n=1 Tax=Eurosta solidaginis TaxID=178769 RepID=UPI003530E352
MPICNKPSLALSQSKSATEFNDHASEAAKMKRTREQAYFNSYNFDAIEQVFPYCHDMQKMEEEGNDAAGEEGGKQKVIPKVGKEGGRTPIASNSNTVPSTNVPSLLPNTGGSCHGSVSNQQQHKQSTLKTIYRGSSSLTSSQSNPSSSNRSSICECQRSDHCSNDSDCCLHHPHSDELTYAYMQRFGTLLLRSPNASPSSYFVEEDGDDVDALNVEKGNDVAGRSGVLSGRVVRRESGVSVVASADVVPVHGKCETEAALKENFLLPRAMLKCPSVGNAISMPLAANNSGHADKLLQNGHNYQQHIGKSNKNHNNTNNENNNYTNSNVTSSNNKYNSNNNRSAKGIMMTPNAINNNNKHTNHTNNNNNISSINKSNSITNINNKRALNKINNYSSHNSHISHGSNSNNNLTKSRQNYAKNKDGYASLLVDKDINAIAPLRATTTVTTKPTTPAAVAENRKLSLEKNSTPGAVVRVKKQSTSSTITTTTTTESSVSAERDDSVDRNNDHDANHEKTRTNGKGTTSNGGNKTKLAQSIGSERRGHTSSHQSHYSTDKSGSSGYYSSNVCSTYSLDEHIYCEPVIDILDVSKGAKARQIANASDNKKITATTAKLSKTRVQEMSHKGDAASKRDGGGRRNSARTTSATTRATTSRNGESGIAGCSEELDDDEDFDAEDGKVICSPHIEHNKSNDAMDGIPAGLQFLLQRQTSEESQHLSENLRLLETSIENLDRHLKRYPSLSSHERIAAFVHSHHQHAPHFLQHHEQQQQQQQHEYLQPSEVGDKLRLPPTAHHNHHSHHYLPTIMEGYDPTTQPHRPWPSDMVDDSLLDIDLDSFLLVNEKRKAGVKQIRQKPQMRDSSIDNATFLTEEQEEENNYKCAKYINSCPDDAYRVESDIVAAAGSGIGCTGTATASEKSISLVDHYMKRYEDQMHFQSTRELLEDVRDKIRLLSQASRSTSHSPIDQKATSKTNVEELPLELEGMIKTLKKELENYLDRMNQHSELEIRQFCSGLVRNQNIVKMKKAFERRRSTHSIGTLESDYGYNGNYEAICDGGGGVPTNIREQIVSIRCASDPNFKMKRKSLTEVFPVSDCYTEPSALQRTLLLQTKQHQRPPSLTQRDRNFAVVAEQGGVYQRDQNIVTLHKPTTQLQRNLSFQQPVLNKLDAKTLTAVAIDAEVSDKSNANSGGSNSAGDSNGSGAESGDKDSILEWHRKKPSIWEMYYGTNRKNQSLLGKRNALVSNSNNQVTMSYPSSRPESDFTLDLPRAEQLRIKMEKEKKFRQRCRYITTFLSLVFFLLTVMVVSLVLTRGKRMFGSMI